MSSQRVTAGMATLHSGAGPSVCPQDTEGPWVLRHGKAEGAPLPAESPPQTQWPLAQHVPRGPSFQEASCQPLWLGLWSLLCSVGPGPGGGSADRMTPAAATSGIKSYWASAGSWEILWVTRSQQDLEAGLLHSLYKHPSSVCLCQALSKLGMRRPNPQGA